MLKRILIATDLSEASAEVIGSMHFLYCLGSREAVLMHCVSVRDAGALTEELREGLSEPLEEQRTLLEKQGFQAAGELVEGLPHLEINRMAEEKDCSMIVVGSHGYGVLGTALLGGVASGVLQSATRPVLVIRLKIIEENECTSCRAACEDPGYHVLYATDFSDASERAFTFVERIVESGCKHVTLLHVQDKARIGRHPEDRIEEFNRIDQSRLEKLRAVLEEKGAADVSIHIPYGSPIKEILDASRENGVSLIVMGSQGRRFIRELFLGSVSNSVVRRASTPVLLVPAIR